MRSVNTRKDERSGFRSTLLLGTVAAIILAAPSVVHPLQAQGKQSGVRDDVILEVMTAQRVREQGLIGDSTRFEPRLRTRGQFVAGRNRAHAYVIARALGARIVRSERVRRCKPNHGCSLDGVRSLVAIGAPRIRGDEASILVEVFTRGKGAPLNRHIEYMHFKRVGGTWMAVQGGLSIDS